MGFWPFGRKKRRSSRIQEKAPSTTDPCDPMPQPSVTGSRPPPSGGQTVTMAGRDPASNDNKRRKREPTKAATSKPAKLQPKNRPGSTPSRAQTAPQSRPIGEKLSIGNDMTSSPSHPTSQSIPSHATTRAVPGDPSYYLQNPTSQSSLGPENFTAIPLPPTLRAKRSSAGQSVNRRKSSKRKAEDQAREREIRALSSPVPPRPIHRATEPLRRDTKMVAGGLNRHLDRPTSNISLPLAESLHESMSDASEYHTFTVKAFNALTPRPTLRYSDNSQQGPLRSLNQSRASAPNQMPPTIPETEVKSKKRIEGLADNLTATELREIMEREQRRRHRKEQENQEKLRRKLERRATRQQEEEKRRIAAQLRGTGERGRRNVERGPSGGEQMDVETGVSGTQQEGKKPQDPFADESPKSAHSWLQDASQERLPKETSEDPFKDETSETRAPQDTRPTFVKQEQEEETDLFPPSFPERQPRNSQGSAMSAPSAVTTGRGYASTSQTSGLGKELTLEIPENADANRRDSDTSGRHVSSWTSFFRRGKRQRGTSGERGFTTPSEFSNTSRESVSRQPPPQIPPRSFRRSGSTPVRTMSKFREDLPELPISPPASRIQSPTTPAAAMMSSPHPDLSSHERGETTAGGVDKSETSDIPRESGRESAHISMQSNASALASVDSEGSWLSGKPIKRTSQSSAHALGSPSAKHFRETGDEDDHGLLTPGLDDPIEVPAPLRFKSASPASGDESDEDAFPLVGEEQQPIHRSLEQFPTIVHSKRNVKSREGLLQEFHSSESEPEVSPEVGGSPIGDSPEPATGPSEDQYVQRATSVDYGKKHARHISAGSAKLLDLPPRTSVESRRQSGEKQISKGGSAAVEEEK